MQYNNNTEYVKSDNSLSSFDKVNNKTRKSELYDKDHNEIPEHFIATPTIVKEFNSDNEIDEKIVLLDNVGNVIPIEETIEVDATYTNEVGETKSRRVSVIKFNKEEKHSSSSSSSSDHDKKEKLKE
jgi:hypothetical protein